VVISGLSARKDGCYSQTGVKGKEAAMSKKAPGRDERLAAALRVNLKRRKEAQRAAAKPAMRESAQTPVDSLKSAKKPR
jgi:hypothetical protein